MTPLPSERSETTATTDGCTPSTMSGMSPPKVPPAAPRPAVAPSLADPLGTVFAAGGEETRHHQCHDKRQTANHHVIRPYRLPPRGRPRVAVLPPPARAHAEPGRGARRRRWLVPRVAAVERAQVGHAACDLGRRGWISHESDANGAPWPRAPASAASTPRIATTRGRRCTRQDRIDRSRWRIHRRGVCSRVRRAHSVAALLRFPVPPPRTLQLAC